MPSYQLGEPLPPTDRHSISVSLPTWADILNWAGRNPDTLAKLKTGYPRFFIPRIVEELVAEILDKEPKDWHKNRTNGSTDVHAQAGSQNVGMEHVDVEKRHALLFASLNAARVCWRFMSKEEVSNKPSITLLSFDSNGDYHLEDGHVAHTTGEAVNWQKLFVVAYPAILFPSAKAFWQHTGYGISSRFAEYWLRTFTKSERKIPATQDDIELDRNDGEQAKSVIKTRAAELESTSTTTINTADVFLYPTGMSSLASIAAVLKQQKEKTGLKAGNIAVFGFLYVDTFKVLSRVYEFELKLYGNASGEELDELEKNLAAGHRIDAVYTEFPGNPRLQSPDLQRLYRLSKLFDFLLVVDNTVGTPVNLALIDHCDVICHSLSKMFSGECNVMGGYTVLNPRSSKHDTLHADLTHSFLDTYFPPDAIIMERNSRNFSSRVLTASANAAAMVAMLREHPLVKAIFYPENSPTQNHYDTFKRPGGLYSFLVSITFFNPSCAIAFHDDLDIAKGPSLGTNFSLGCAYTLLAHFKELEWAAQYGVEEHLVRISVGIEDRKEIERVVKRALQAAEKAAEKGEGQKSMEAIGGVQS